MNQAFLEAADQQEQDPVTVGAYLTSWLDHTRGRVRAKTHDGYQAQIRLYVLPPLEAVLLADVNPLLLQRLYGDLLAKGLSGGTVLNLHLVLTQALAQAARWGLIAANPAAGAQPPRPRRPEIAVVDPSLAERILEAVEGTRFNSFVYWHGLEAKLATKVAAVLRQRRTIGQVSMNQVSMSQATISQVTMSQVMSEASKLPGDTIEPAQ